MMTRRSGYLGATTPTRQVTTIHGGRSLSMTGPSAQVPQAWAGLALLMITPSSGRS